MQIRKDGIYKTIDEKDFGIYQSMGFEKIVAAPIDKPKKPVVEEKVEEPIIEEEPVIDELPKSKKKKK